MNVFLFLNLGEIRSTGEHGAQNSWMHLGHIYKSHFFFHKGDQPIDTVGQITAPTMPRGGV